MKIGIDLDDVTAEFFEALIQFYNQKTGLLMTKDKLTNPRFWESMGCTKDEIVSMIEDFHQSEHFDHIRPVDRAVDSIQALLKTNELFIISARKSQYKEKTITWFSKHLQGMPIEIIFSGDFYEGQGKRKAEICAELGITVMIEDHGAYALECAKAGIQVFMFDKPWNKETYHELIRRINNWDEVTVEINGMNAKLAPTVG